MISAEAGTFPTRARRPLGPRPSCPHPCFTPTGWLTELTPFDWFAAANAYLKRQTFSEYKYNPPPQSTPVPTQDDDDDGFDPPPGEPRCMFGISLITLLECLNIFGNAGGGLGPGGYGPDEGAKDGGGTTSLEMKYAGEGEPLIVL